MPLFYINEIDRDTQLAIWKMDESLDELFYNPKLHRYQEEVAQFKSEKRKKEWLATRLLLQCVSPLFSEISYHESGKPFILGSEKKISISHTKGYVLLIVSKTNLVSIDAETFSDKILRVVPRVMRKDESFALYRTPLISQILIWCAKETLYKLLDYQYIDYSQDLKVLPFVPQKRVGLIYAMQFVDDNLICRYIPINYLLFDDFAVTYSVIKNIQM